MACYIPRWYTRPKTITHPGTNRARRALTSFIRRTPLATALRRQRLHRFVVDLLYHLFLHCCAAFGKILTDTASRAVRQTSLIYGCAACSASDRFKCPNVDRCIHAALVCDGENQCGDGSDELNCGKPHLHYFNQSTSQSTFVYNGVTKSRPAVLSINNCSCN